MAGSEQGSADEQAAAWLARFQSRSVSTAELEEFARWRRDPDNATAYEHAQAVWDGSARLSNDPDIQDALHRREPRRDHDLGRFVSHPVMMVATVLVAVVLVIGVLSFRVGSPAHAYQTAVGERSDVRLADGSALQLDTNSEVAARFGADERRVTLGHGQAFFRVAHDSTRPFVVDAGDGITVTATGTAFDVRRTAERVQVALLEGSVVVERAGTELARMKPGSTIEIAIGNGVVASTRTVAEATNWRSGRLSFRATPLAEAVAEMNRYTDAKLRIQNPEAENEPISGEFSVDDPAGFARAVDALLGQGTIAR